MKNNYIVFFLLFFLSVGAQAQNTVALLSHNPSEAFEGYNLLYPHHQPNVYLLDNCGEVVHLWEDSNEYRPGNTAYILPDGNLIKTKRLNLSVNDPIWAGGGGDWVEIRDWDNNLLWNFQQNDAQRRLHHDIAPMPNGHILMISWELKTGEEAIQAGRNPELLSQGKLWPDYILEIDPETDEIVWEWHTWDHLIQDFDPSRDNYGVVADHPELIDINWDTSDGHPDWMHTNAIDYNPVLDQILISVPTFGEVWVIDHSTTTEEAAGHTGGLGGRGGDLLYRWGNPLTYRAGSAEEQTLFYPHDIHWVDDFLDDSHPHYGKIAIFNNRVGEDFSTVNVFDPGFDQENWSYAFSNGQWNPVAFDLTITHPIPERMYSTGLSSFQLLPNGNYLICSGREGYSFELNANEEVIWEYINPMTGGNPVPQGSDAATLNNLTFRVKRYPADYAAFTGRALEPQGFIELNPDEDFCDQVSSAPELTAVGRLKVYPNPAAEEVTVEWAGGAQITVEVFDGLGRRTTQLQTADPLIRLDVSNWTPGMYWVRLNNEVVEAIMVGSGW